MSKRHCDDSEPGTPRLEKRGRFIELPTGSSDGPSARKGRSRSLGPHCNGARNERLRNRVYMSEPPMRVTSKPFPAAPSESNLQNQEQGTSMNAGGDTGDTNQSSAQEELEGSDVNKSDDPDL